MRTVSIILYLFVGANTQTYEESNWRNGNNRYSTQYKNLTAPNVCTILHTEDGEPGPVRGGNYSPGNAPVVARPSYCQPRDQIEYLGPNIVPNQITVKKCVGYCSERCSCKATRSESLQYSVFVKQEYPKKNEYGIIEIEQHTSCDCGCIIQPQDCHRNHVYNSATCRCDCPRTENCRKKGGNKIWDFETCQCVCRYKRICGSGHVWNSNICQCVSPR